MNVNRWMRHPWVTRDLRPITAASLGIALLMAGASLAGLMYPERFYPTEDLRQAFMATDVVNLGIGLPILLGSMWLARPGNPSDRGRLLGVLFWPGALFYVLYHYIVYAFGLPLSWGFLLAVVLLTSSAYTLAGLLAGVDGAAVRQRLAGNVPARWAGGVLAGMGVVFALRALVMMVNGITGSMVLGEAELALQVSDFIITGAWVVAGALLWRRETFGYVTGTGLLFQASMLFVGLLVYFILLPFLTATPFPVEDFVAILVMGLISFVPFGLFLRGILRSR